MAKKQKGEVTSVAHDVIAHETMQQAKCLWHSKSLLKDDDRHFIWEIVIKNNNDKPLEFHQCTRVKKIYEKFVTSFIELSSSKRKED